MIIRAEKNKDYTVLRNTALNDEKLSLKAKGLWAYLMSKPDTWDISISGSTSQLKESKDAVRAAFNELEERGYLVRGKLLRNEQGKFYNESAILYETPVTALEKPTQEKPTQENPTQVNTDKVNTDKVNSNAKALLSSSSLYQQEKPSFGNSAVNKIIETFEEVLGMKLTDKARQRQYAATLVKQFGENTVIEGIRFYATIRTERYAPQIDNVESLFYKFNKLKGYADRRAAENNKTKAVDLDDL